MMLTSEQDHATIRRPDFEKMFNKISERVVIKHKSITHQNVKITELRAKLAGHKKSVATCTHTVKSTLVEVDTTTHKV